MSYLLTLKSTNKPNSADFTTNFPSRIELKGMTYQCALTNIYLSNSLYNVSYAKNNNIFTYWNGVDWVGLIIPDGVYSTESLIRKIHQGMRVEGDYTEVDGVDTFDINFYPNLENGTVDLELTNGYEVDFTGDIRNLFGFDSDIYDDNATSQNKGNIDAGIEKVMVHCSLISGSSYVDGQESDVIYSFSISDALENEKMTVTPQTLLYVKVNETNQINYIRMYLTDQTGRTLDFNNTPISYDLHITPLFLNFPK